jgi:hypothetical protein
MPIPNCTIAGTSSTACRFSRNRLTPHYSPPPVREKFTTDYHIIPAVHVPVPIKLKSIIHHRYFASTSSHCIFNFNFKLWFLKSIDNAACEKGSRYRVAQ